MSWREAVVLVIAMCAALTMGFYAGVDYQQSEGYEAWCHAHGGEMTYIKEREAVYCASVAQVKLKGKH